MGNSYSEQVEYLNEIVGCAEWVLLKYRAGKKQFIIEEEDKKYFDMDFDMIAEYVQGKEDVEIEYKDGQVIFINSIK